MNKFLILGTGEDINDIDFTRLDSDFITAGVNRIFYKYIPDYYYVYDLDIIQDLIPDEIEHIYTHPDKLYQAASLKKNYKQNFTTYYDKNYTPEYQVNGKRFDCGHGSVNYLIRMLNNLIYPSDDNKFYLCGVPLLEDVGHFYEDDKTTTNQKVLDRFYNDFLRMKSLNYNIVSLMEKSKLNDIFPIEKKEVLYV